MQYELIHDGPEFTMEIQQSFLEVDWLVNRSDCCYAASYVNVLL